MHVSSLRLRRRALGPVLGLVVLCAGVAPAVTTLAASAAGTVSSRRHLVLIRRDPATVQGSGFRAHRRVRVTLAAGRTYVRRPLANRRGGFTVTFPAAVDRCTAWSVTAVQGAATRIAIRGPRPECAPASTP